MSDRTEFAGLTDPFRHELLVHCYRMLGSVDDAEDLVQETYLRAWRSYEGFEGKSSLRTWLYRIATNACLRAIEHRSRRFLPSGLGLHSSEPDQTLTPGLPDEATWLRPIPDTLLATSPSDPATVVSNRSSVRLAFVAALQHLPGRQRAVLILRDVLRWRAGEVAVMLGTTTAAVNSALQRARAQLAQAAPVEDKLGEPSEPERRALLDRYLAAFEEGDVDSLTRLLLDEAVWEMPPVPEWFQGRETIGRFLSSHVFGAAGGWRLVPTHANGQPAFAAYLRGSDGAYHAHCLKVLTLAPAGIARIVAFLDTSLFSTFSMAGVHGVRANGPVPR